MDGGVHASVFCFTRGISCTHLYMYGETSRKVMTHAHMCNQATRTCRGMHHRPRMQVHGTKSLDRLFSRPPLSCAYSVGDRRDRLAPKNKIRDKQCKEKSSCFARFSRQNNFSSLDRVTYSRTYVN
jgi:hypothetical protein